MKKYYRWNPSLDRCDSRNMSTPSFGWFESEHEALINALKSAREEWAYVREKILTINQALKKQRKNKGERK